MKKQKPKKLTRKRKCLRCDKLVELPVGFFMCTHCRTVAGNDEQTEYGMGSRKG